MSLVREAGLKCVLSGDGADETLGGYPTYLAHQPQPSRSFAADSDMPSTGCRPDRWGHARLHGQALRERPQRAVAAPTGLDGQLVRRGIGAGEAAWARTDSIAQESGGDTVGRAMGLDQRMYLSDESW